VLKKRVLTINVSFIVYIPVGIMTVILISFCKKQIFLSNLKNKIMKNTFELNGVTYQERPRNTGPTVSKPIGRLMAMAMMFGGLSSVVTKKQQSVITPNYSSLIDEYKLILEKKSKLSRSERDSVIRDFNRHYQPIQPTES
jgi:hypothetical protein